MKLNLSHFKKLTNKNFYYIFLPVSVFTLLVTFFTLFVIDSEKVKSIDTHFFTKVTIAQKDFNDAINEHAIGMAMVATTISQENDVRQSLINSNKNSLLEKYSETFSKLKEENSITHLYFLDKNRKTILRVHMPEREGDYIGRFTAKKAESSHKISYGIELGVMGTLTLRVVVPVIKENEIIGYVELGKEIEDILEKISNKHGVELLLMITKSNLTEESWKQGMKMLEREANWKLFDKFALIYTTQKYISPNLTKLINSSDKAESVTIDEKIFMLSADKVNDVSNREIGQLIFLQDLTNIIKERDSFIIQSILFGLVSMTIFLLLIYFILRRSEINSELQNQEILKNGQRVQELQKLSKIIAWEVDKGGLYTFISDSVYEILGYKEGEIVNKKYFYDLYPLEKKDSLKNIIFDNLYKKESFTDMAIPVLNINNEIVWFSINGIPVLDDNGELLGCRGIGRDITQEVTKEKIAQEANNLFRKIINAIPQRIFWKDLDLHYLGCNEAFAKDSGNLFSDDIIGKDDYQMAWAEHAKEYRIDDRNVINSGIPKLFYEEEIKTSSGESMWISTSKIPLINNDGRTVGIIGVFEDFSDKKNTEDKIHKLAFYDTLTSLPNRILFIDIIKAVMKEVALSHAYTALIFIDLDNFKILNDTLGHEMGDILLQSTAKRLQTIAKNGNSLARLGGDEFVLILKNLSTDEAKAKNECIRTATQLLALLQEPYQLKWAEHKSSASVGITLFNSDQISIDNLMKQAELALYRSKECGRNAFKFFEPVMESSLKERAEIEKELREAINKEEFVLFYQAQIDKSKKVVGAEALVRWNHPTKGLVSPMLFIPVAEECDIILKLGDWILKSACSELQRWSRIDVMKEITLAINISVKQFSQNNFVKNTLSIIKESGVNPRLIKLEITESMLVKDKESIIEKMSKLKEVGIQFSLDDFGTGYSSLSYLKQLPIDQLKIDQSFVRDILTDKNDEIICKSTIAIAHSMGLNVIAEGVETQEQREMLNSLGCTTYQGYLFSKPIPSREFEIFVIEHD
ncbi:MAG: EAL domain-containing protein [Sulfurimonas sp.]|jgi:diguanylate cyclase (GGDEF)-like protein/PAS domain S-box-containing protein